MADPVLLVTDTFDAAKEGDTTLLGKVPPGTTSAETSERLHNNLAGAPSVDTATDLVLVIVAKIQGSTEFTVAGIDVLERRGVEVRLDQLNSVPVTEPFVALGSGIQLRVPDLASGEFHEYTVRVRPAAGASEDTTVFKVAFASVRFGVVGDPAAVDPGIRRGIGDGATTAILSRSGTITTSGVGDLLVPDYSWVYLGTPHSELLNTKTLDDQPASGPVLISGESYAYRLVLDATETIIKGDKVTGTAVFDDLPLLPQGNRFLGWGVRDFVSNLTFTPIDPLPDYFLVTTAGLNFTVARAGTGASMMVAGHKLDPTTSTGGLMTASSDNDIWMLRDGSAAVTLDESSPEDGAEVLARITTDGSGETSRVELRRWHGGEQITFDMGLVGNNQVAFWRNGTTRTRWVRSDMVSAHRFGTIGADTVGELKFDLLVKEQGVAEATMFPDQGSDDRRPGWVFGDTNEGVFGLPTELAIPPGALLVCRAALTAFDISSAFSAAVSILTDEG